MTRSKRLRDAAVAGYVTFAGVGRLDDTFRQGYGKVTGVIGAVMVVAGGGWLIVMLREWLQDRAQDRAISSQDDLPSERP